MINGGNGVYRYEMASFSQYSNFYIDATIDTVNLRSYLNSSQPIDLCQTPTDLNSQDDRCEIRHTTNIYIHYLTYLSYLFILALIY